MSVATEIRIGGCYAHKTHGSCVVTHHNSRGYWIQVWGGTCGDKLYTFKGIAGDDLSPRNAACRECLDIAPLINGLCDDCREY